MKFKKIKIKDLEEGQRFWIFKADLDDPDLESIIKDGFQVWADGAPIECTLPDPEAFVYAHP